MNDIFIYDIKYAGEEASSKIKRVRTQMEISGQESLRTIIPEEVAWLLNLRGKGAGAEYADEVKKFSPVFLCELEMTKDSMTFYVNQELSGEVEAYLDKLNVKVIQKELEEKEIEIEKDKTLISELQKIKNDIEIKNMEEIFLDDGVVFTKFIYWLKTHVGKETITEMDVKQKMEELRSEVEDYFMPSFETIPGYMEDGANIHYHVTKDTNREVKPEGIIMVDAGGQYLRGTTDTTRTFALGDVTDKMKEMYTAVLKGHIDVTLSKFGEGTTGDVLDEIARKHIKEKGLDYAHGTGHGLGHFLNVHEHPRRVFNEKTKIYENMTFSNEPGVYLEGEFGIRIENIVRTVMGDDGKLSLKTFTIVPYEKELIDFDCLDEDELKYLKGYQKMVIGTLKGRLNDDEYEWLKDQMI